MISELKSTGDMEPVPLPPMIERYGESIQSALRSELSQSHSFVYDMLRYYIGWADETGAPVTATTGKAVRPTLCLFGCEAVGGTASQALPAAVALEFIHNFSLVHDDIQDEDETRHGRKTIWAVWGKAQGTRLRERAPCGGRLSTPRAALVRCRREPRRDSG